MANLVEVKVPDIGDFTDIPVIEILVKPGDTVKKEDSLVSLESDKASMEVPSSHAGVVKELKVKLGDKVSMGAVVLVLEEGAGAAAAPAAPPTPAAAPAQTPAPGRPAEVPAPKAVPVLTPSPATASAPSTASEAIPSHVHASPSVRAFARELGVDLTRVKGTALKGRITKEDVQGFVKTELAKPKGASATGGAFAFPEMPHVDFTKFGEIEKRALSRIKKLSGNNLARNWVMIPHVTQQEEADITESISAVKMARAGNRKFNQLYADKLMKSRGRRAVEDDRDLRMRAEVIAETVVLDWKNLKANGEPWLYSKANVVKIVMDETYADFFELLMSIAQDASYYKLETEDAVIKNS